ncbi:hypothetical protein HA51_16280 [Pantoea rwandensis]|uniref:Uncharacterized protein n=1 Tax=Pantoea rwandensis TaxID=1076550 RepID=A0A1X1CV59_9GAMM|nr:hypothetical protein HA51_16280 [Pantoea rwandensis]
MFILLVGLHLVSVHGGTHQDDALRSVEDDQEHGRIRFRQESERDKETSQERLGEGATGTL